MNKTITININGIVFTIEEDAYKALEQYLESIKKQFETFEDKEDIIADIEARIAENLQERLKKNQVVVLLEDVQAIMETMGAASAFSEEDETSESETTKNKRLYRSSEDQVIAGVCSGLAAYFGIDPVILRVLFAILTVTGVLTAVIIIGYIVLWVSVPEAKSISEKMEMKGDNVTLKNIEETVRDTIKKKDLKSSVGQAAERSASGLKAVMQKVFNIIHQVFSGLVKGGGVIAKGLSMIIGAIILIASFFSILVSAAFFSMIAFNADSPMIDIPLTVLGQGISFFVLIGVAFIVCLIPLIFLVLLGASALKRKNIITLAPSVSLLVVWVVAVALTAGLGFKAAPEIQSAVEQAVNEEHVSQEVEVTNISQLRVMSDYTFTVKEGKKTSVILTGRASDIEDVSVDIENTEMTISRGQKICFFCIQDSVHADITLSELEWVKLHHSTSGTISGFEQDLLFVDLSGASQLALDADIKELTVEQSGASRLDMVGESTNLFLDMSGASRFNGNDYTTSQANIEGSGASEGELSVTDELDVKLSGASELIYRGEPGVKKKISGGAELEQRPSINDQEKDSESKVK